MKMNASNLISQVQDEPTELTTENPLMLNTTTHPLDTVVKQPVIDDAIGQYPLLYTATALIMFMVLVVVLALGIASYMRYRRHLRHRLSIISDLRYERLIANAPRRGHEEFYPTF